MHVVVAVAHQEWGDGDGDIALTERARALVDRACVVIDLPRLRVVAYEAGRRSRVRRKYRRAPDGFRAMRFSIRVLSLLMLAAPAVRAYADADREPLWKMISGSSSIALVRIAGTYVPWGGESRVARADVLEVWKGAAPAKVQFIRDETWRDVRYVHPPSPFVVDPSTPTVIVFMRDDPRGGAPTPLLNWGLLEPRPEDIGDFRQCIKSGAALKSATPNSPESLDWFADCVARRATRGHALAGFLPERGWQDAPTPSTWINPLSDAHKRRIMAGFVSEPSDDDTFPQVLFLVGTVPDASFDARAIDVMERVLRPAPAPAAAAKLPPDVVKMMNYGNPEFWSGAAYALLLARLGEDAKARVAGWPRNVNNLFPLAGQLRADWEAVKRTRSLKPNDVDARASYVNRSWIRLRD